MSCKNVCSQGQITEPQNEAPKSSLPAYTLFPKIRNNIIFPYKKHMSIFSSFHSIYEQN